MSVLDNDFALHQSSQAQLEAYLHTPAHAVLLSGPVGIGKTHIAASLGGKLLNLSNAKLEKSAYYRVVTADGNSIGIEQIRGLIRFFQLKVPGAAAIKRVAVIQDAESMTIEAQNALLKILEEPPTDSVIILTSSLPVQLLTTIRSRLQDIRLAAPTKQALREYFVTAGYTDVAVSAALLRSDTNVAELKRILSADDDVPDSSVTLVKQALGGKRYDRMLLVDSLSKQKDDTRAFIDTLATIATLSLESAANKGTTTLERWAKILQASHVASDALEHNGNAKLLLTELMLSL